MKLTEYFYTPRMQAKRIHANDFEDIRLMHQDPQAMKTLGGVRSLETSQQNMIWNLQLWETHGIGLWVFREPQSLTFIGLGGLRYLSILGVQELDLGYCLMPHYWGQGLGTEMAKASVSMGFEHRQANNIVACTQVSNQASRHIMEKLHFCYEKEFEQFGQPHVLYRLNKTRQL